MKAKRNYVFVSYSHNDSKKSLDRLRVHLRPLIKEGEIDLWDDSRIKPGSNWREEIQKAIDKASVAILLVSANFLASDFINDNELPPLLEKAKKDGAIIIPVIVSPCRFIETKNISQFQSINDPAQPLDSQSSTKREKVFMEVSNHISRIFAKLEQNDEESEISDLIQENEIINIKSHPLSIEDTEGEFTHISRISIPVISQITDMAKSEYGLLGISTGFRDLDQIISGLQPGELILVAAKPYMGLSAFGLSIALNTAIFENSTIAFFSMQMPKEKFVRQMICAEARVDEHRFSTAYLTRDEWTRIQEGLQTLEEIKIFIDDRNELTIHEIQVTLRKFLTEQKKLDLVIIDNLQHIHTSQNTVLSNQDVWQIPRGLKEIAREFQIPVVLLCPLPMSGNIPIHNRPTLFDLKDAGSIKEFADVSLLIHRAEIYSNTEENKGIANILVVKNDDGSSGIINLAFLNEFNRFENYFGE